MSDVNVFVVSGNLVSDPELRSVSGGQSVAKFRIASNRVYKGKQATNFFDGEIWGIQAENFAKYLSKGRGVIIKGRLKQDTWVVDDQRRQKIVLVAEDYTFMGPPKSQKQEDHSEPEDTSDTDSAELTVGDIPF